MHKNGLFKLAIVEVRIEAALAYQLFMGALLDDVAVAHNED